MRQAVHKFEVQTRGKGLYELTALILNWVDQQKFATGLLTIFCQHTSASLLIQENADPDVKTDLEHYFERVAPENPGAYTHTLEGPDDMPAHIRAALTQTQLTIPIAKGRPTLGTWQGIYLFEHRRSPHRRNVVVHAFGE